MFTAVPQHFNFVIWNCSSRKHYSCWNNRRLQFGSCLFLLLLCIIYPWLLLPQNNAVWYSPVVLNTGSLKKFSWSRNSLPMWYAKVHYHVDKSSSLDPIWTTWIQLIPPHIIPANLSLILPPLYAWVPPWCFQTKLLFALLVFPYVLYVQPI